MAGHSKFSHRIALAATLITAAAVTMGASGCSTISAIVNGQPTQADYPTWSAVHPVDEHSSGDLPKPPAFVPHDATQMYVRALPTGAAILTFQSTQQPDPALCHPGALTGAPKLDANWWPIAKPPAEGLLCASDWRLFSVKGVAYGWRAAN